MTGQRDQATVFRTSHAAGGVIGLHRHAAPYTAVVLEGQYVEFSVDGVWVCEPGDLVIHPAWHLHANQFSNRRCTVLNIELTSSGADRLVAMGRVWRARDVRPLLGGRAEPQEQLEQVLERAEPRPALPAPGSLGLFLSELRGEGRPGVAASAARAGMSREHASRIFRRYLGLPPRSYLVEERFRRALDLLLRAELPLAAVAHEAGYADQAHFTRSFRSATRMSPGELRRRIRTQGRITFVQ
jgi:AraC-like DNA-binding protein